MSKESSPREFHVNMRARKSVTKSWLWWTGLFILATLIGFKSSSLLTNSFLSRTLIFCLVLGLLFFAVVFLLYLGRLHFTKRNRLEFNEEGLYDYASFCELGFVPMQSITDIQFSHLLGQEFLCVRFAKQQHPLRGKPGFRAEMYRLLFGVDLWIPVGLFQLSRIDLESQIIHLDQLLKNKTGSAIAGRTRISVVDEKTADRNPLSVVSGVHVSIPPVPATTQEGDLPPPLTSERIEKNFVLEKINQIKQDVKTRGFDRIVANLYLDQLANFPILTVKNILPPGVSDVQSNQQGTDYEEVRFKYSGQTFSFGLRRDIGPSDEALLSVGVGGRVHFSLRVRVEIGELQPLDIESFIPGEWQSLIEQLDLTIQQLAKAKLELTGAFDPQTQTSTNIEDLKNRFGLKE